MRSVAVIGGGPGGAAAALHLVRSGVDVTIYRPARPGEKPCGGAVPDYLLPRLSGFDSSGLPVVVASRAVLENGQGGRLEVPLEGVKIFRRGDLDPALVRAAVAADARLVPQKVTGLRWNGHGVVVEAGGEARTYRWVLAADGARGLSRRSLGLAPVGDSVGLGASVAGVRESRLVLSFPNVADAYLWIFPRPGGISVGIAYSEDQLSAGAANAQLGAFLTRFLGADHGRSGKRYRYPIPVFSSATVAAIRHGLAHRLLLVGDAAAVADPLTREGIRYAILSGQWAAESLVAGQPEEYVERIAAELGPEMERARRARRLFFQEPIGQWMVPMARAHPGIRRVLQQLVSCRQPYTGLRRRLLRAAIGLP